MKSFRHKNIRLSSAEYTGRKVYFLTICCESRRAVFSNSKRAEWLIIELHGESNKHRFLVHAYCVMPDHFHVLVEGASTDSNLLAFAKSFKQKTSFGFRRETGFPLWEKKFHDHILRRDVAIDRIAWYIWMNPVRKGLCTVPMDYPFSGSFTMSWKDERRFAETWVPEWKNVQGGLPKDGRYRRRMDMLHESMVREDS